MTRSEYFVKWRASLLELDDRTLGAYVLRYARPFASLRGAPPPAQTSLELYDALFPTFSAGQGDESVPGDPDVRTLRRLVEYASGPAERDTPPSMSAAAKYEATVFALGQQARDMLTGDPTTLWNVHEEKRRAQATEWGYADKAAVSAEEYAARVRARATELRAALDATEATLRALAAKADERSAAVRDA